MNLLRCLFLLLFILSSCTSFKQRGAPKQGKDLFSYYDASGAFQLSREHRVIGKNLVTRTQLLTEGNGSKLLEKTVAVSQLGSVRSRNKRILVVRPKASEFTVWLEGKRYFTKLALNPQSKSMIATSESPETGKRREEIHFPKGQFFCFFSQLADCLYQNQLLILSGEAKEESFPFMILWESYPFTSEQYTGAGKALFSSAILKFDGEVKGLYRYIVEVDGQMIMFQFTKSFNLVRMAWIAQGITIAPPGEDVAADIE